MKPISKPHHQKQILQSNNQELNKELRYKNQNSNQHYINLTKSLHRNVKTQIPSTPDPYPLHFEHDLQYQDYLISKLIENIDQFKPKQKNESKQPWKNLKNRSKFLQSLYIDHLLHQEHDDDELEKKKQN